MATMKAIQCREHGGVFHIPARRGRPPVRCSEDNRCDMTKPVKSVPRKKSDAELLTRNKTRFTKGSGGRRPSEIAMAEVERAEAEFSAAEAARETRLAAMQARGTANGAPKKARKKRAEAPPVTVRHNPSIPLARHAREQLEPLGWSLTGRAWFEDHPEEEDVLIGFAEVVGTRGDETVILRWKGGKPEDQHYSIWDTEKVSTNGKPKSRLPFDPDTLSDVELANELRGRKVTWWNRLAKGKETAIVGDKFQIQHNYDEGREHARMVLFVDKHAGGFRAFHVDALMKVD